MEQHGPLAGAEGAVIGPALFQRQAVIAVAGHLVGGGEQVVFPEAHRANIGDGLLFWYGKGPAAAAGTRESSWTFPGVNGLVRRLGIIFPDKLREAELFGLPHNAVPRFGK